MHPPVDTAFYTPEPDRLPEPFFLAVSALVPYKRLDVAIRAVARVGGALTVVGRGPEEGRLRGLAASLGASVTFSGWVGDDQVRDLYRRSRAVLMPGVEDFGMVPVEAQACGRPVVALAEGGALDSVIDGVTGILVKEPSVDAFADALNDVPARAFDPVVIRRHAETFGKERFQAQFRAIVDVSVSRDSEHDPRDVSLRRSSYPNEETNAARYAQDRRSPAARDLSTGSRSPRATSRGENKS